LKKAVDAEKYNQEIIWPKKIEINLNDVKKYGFWKDLNYFFLS